MRLRAKFALILLAMVIAAAPASADALIAVAGPAEGRLAERTSRIADGVRETITQINSGGGLAGQPLTLVTVDDGCERGKAEAGARDLVEKKVVLVLGHPCETAASAAAAIYAKASIPFIATASRHPDLTAKRSGPTIFRLSGREDTQGSAVAAILARDYEGKSIALIQDRTQYARALFDQALTALKAKGIKEPIEARIVAGDKDYKATVAKTKDADVVFFAGFPIEAGFVHAALKTAGSHARFIGSDSLATDEFATTFGADAKGVQVVATNDAQGDAAKSGSATDKADAQVALGIFADAAREAGTLDGQKIAAVLSSKTFATASGPVKFDASGDSGRAAFELLEWDGDKWVTAATSGR